MVGDLLVIVDYCRYGNLQSYLTKNRKSFIRSSVAVEVKSTDYEVESDGLVERYLIKLLTLFKVIINTVKHETAKDTKFPFNWLAITIDTAPNRQRHQQQIPSVLAEVVNISHPIGVGTIKQT